MSKLFETGSINGLEMSNRFVRSATWEGMAAEDGSVTPKLIGVMRELARGGVGLIISSHAYVRPDGQASSRQLGVYRDELIPGLRKMADAVHECGGRIVLQLAHGGCLALGPALGRPLAVVSDVDGLPASSGGEMTARDIGDVVAAFADAARRARSAGFDGVQIHSAHGYLLSQFLSPIYNRRRDDYGGSVRNRARVHLEVCRAVRQAVGTDYPLLIKLNCRDFADNGLTLEDSVQVGKLLADAGFDAIELSGGLAGSMRLSPSRSGINTVRKEAYFKEEARAFKKEIGIPLILVGGIRSFETAELLVEDDTADYISMSRPLIREPGLVSRWKSGDHGKSECTSDNRCFRPGFDGDGVYCVTLERERK